MNFEEFLRKALADMPIELHNTECESVYTMGKEDFVERLGNWAWDMFVKYMKHPADSKIYNFDWDEWKDSAYAEIATACLGKKEIEKRLKDLRK